jgi:DNA-binding PadR family transcriptional regulator
MQQEVVLALPAKQPFHGYELRARLRDALGPLGEGMNAGQIYVTLTRLEKAALLAFEGSGDRKVYSLTAAGQQRVAEWIAEVSWPRPDLAEFHLKLTAAATADRLISMWDGALVDETRLTGGTTGELGALIGWDG